MLILKENIFEKTLTGTKYVGYLAKGLLYKETHY